MGGPDTEAILGSGLQPGPVTAPVKRYVALGSSMAAGPGIRPRVAGSPRAAGRSARNYPHLVAQALGFDLVDVTFSGATTANILTESQRGAPPQAEALDGTETLVTVTIGGNDVGYVPMLFAAGLPRTARAVPFLGAKLRDMLDPAARQDALAAVGRKAGQAATALEKATGRPGPVAALDASTAAFAIYRDAECSRQRAMLDAGTGAGDAERSCRILLAEQRALELADR